MGNRNREGFIVHPNWTGDYKWHSSWGPNNNKTNKSFSTLEAAKAYIANQGIKTALIKKADGDSNIIKTQPTQRRAPQRRSRDPFSAMLGRW